MTYLHYSPIKVRKNPFLEATLKRELPGFLTRDNNKALFADLLQTSLEEPPSRKTDT